MQMHADMRGVGVKNRGNYEDVLCGRPHKLKQSQIFDPSYFDRALDVIRILQEFLSKKLDGCEILLELFKMSDGKGCRLFFSF